MYIYILEYIKTVCIKGAVVLPAHDRTFAAPNAQIHLIKGFCCNSPPSPGIRVGRNPGQGQQHQQTSRQEAPWGSLGRIWGSPQSSVPCTYFLWKACLQGQIPSSSLGLNSSKQTAQI